MSEDHGHDLSILDELLELDSGLSAWEMDFLESLDRQRGKDKFSEKQSETLLEICKRRIK